MKVIKRKANWIKFNTLTLRQYFIGILSYITLPFATFKKGAIKVYFEKIYNGFRDDFLFDGKRGLYFEQLLFLIKDKDFKKANIIDLGSGNGALYFWLLNNGFNFDKYIGYDFAHKDFLINDTASIINIDITKIENDSQPPNSVYFLINVLCYLDKTQIQEVFNKLKPTSSLIIIEPVPSVFWDAHFNNVKIHYRKRDEVVYFLKEREYSVFSSSVDYLFQFKKLHFLPLCYSIYAYKELVD